MWAFLSKKIAVIAAVGFLLTPPLLWANPQDGSVVAGSATISNSSNTTQINQSTNKAVINWQSFSIGASETTRFVQPSSSSITLNRVIGINDPSVILGALQANGQVWLINPSGIVFGKSARVDVAGLVATTSNISNADFMAGNYRFTPGSNPRATVINQGHIRVADEGIVALVAPGVENSGVIEANLGKVALASGNAYTVDLYGDRLINFAVGTDPVSAKGVTPDGRVLNDAVSNSGTIIANGGKVLLSANTARHVVDNAVSMGGVIQAKAAVKGRNGEITLLGGDGAVKVSGTMLATNSKGKGGKITVTGNSVRLTSTAKLDASGKKGGGTILVGGDYQGKNTKVANAKQTTVEKGATIKADAWQQGNGGKVIVWADDLTQYAGDISARGGADGGNGGFAEVSGKETLQFAGSVDLRAPKGEIGTLLLDPRDITIQNSGTTTYGFSNPYIGVADSSVVTIGDLLAALNTANVTIQTSSSGAQQGDINIANSFSWSNGNSLTLNAIDDIVFANGVTITNTGGANLNLRADYDGSGAGTVTFGTGASVALSGGPSKVNIYYNPSAYTAPTSYASNVTSGNLTAYMLVNNPTNLTNVSNNLAGTYALGKNIDMTGQTVTRIGTLATNPFTGIFDGQNYTISNINMNLTTLNTALFGYIDVGAIVRNLKLLNASVTSTQARTGVLAAQNAGTISNVVVTGSASGTSLVGLIAGENLGGGSITNASSYGTVSASGGLGGGAVGRNTNGTISNSYSYANVSGGGASIGGFVGSNQSTIAKSFAAGNATSTQSALGGFVGTNTGSISNSYALGAIMASVAASSGGFVGSITAGSISNSYSTGAVNAGGGFAGSSTGGTVSNSYWNKQTSGQAASAAGTGLTASQMKSQASYSGWDFTNIWNIVEGKTYPFQINNSVAVAGGAFDPGDLVQAAAYGYKIANMTVGADTAFNLIVPKNQFVLIYLDNPISGIKSNAVVNFSTSGNDVGLPGTGLNLTTDDVTAFTNRALAQAKGSLADTDILYSVDSSNNLTLDTNTNLLGNVSYQLDGNITSNGGLISFGGAVTFYGKNITLDSGSGDIFFGSTVDGDYGLTLNLSGTPTFSGAVGSNTPLASLNVSGGNTGAFNNGSIRTVGAQSYDGHILLGTDTIFSSLSNGTIVFTGSLSGGFGATINTGGSTIFGSAPGAIIPLASLTTNAGGTTELGTTSVITTGEQTYNDAFIADGPTNLTASTVTFNSTANANPGFTIGGLEITGIGGGSANLVLGANGVIGNTTPFTTLHVNGDTTFNSTATTAVTTSDTQNYSGNVTLGHNTTLDAGGDVNFSSGLDGAFGLTVNAAGNTGFNTVGGTTSLASITTDAAGTTSFNGVVTTSGDQTYNDHVSLVGNSTLTATAGALTLGGTVNGANSLTLNGANNIVLNGAIGNTTPLISLTLTTPALSFNAGTVTTSGSQTYDALLTTLANNLTLTSNSAGAISFINGSNIDGGFNLAVNTTGTTSFTGSIGTSAALNSLTTNAGGMTSFSGGSVRTDFEQTYNDAVSLGSDMDFISLSGGNITFASTLNGARNVSTTTDGTTSFGAVGNSVALTSLTTNGDSVGFTTLNGNVTTTGAQTYNNAVMLGADSVITSTGNSNITFNSSLDGAHALTVNTTGNTNFNGDVGNDTASLTSLITNAGGTTNIGGTIVSTTGAQTFNDNVVLDANSTFSSNGSGNINFIGTLAGAIHSLAVNTSGVTNFNGVSGVTTLTTDAGGSTVIGMPGITTSGTQTYNDAVKIKAGTVPTDQVEIGGGLLRFNSTLDSFDNLNKGQLQLNSAAVFNNYVGSIIPLGYLTASAVTMNAGNSSAATVNTSGFQLYNGAITLGADTILRSTDASSAGVFLLNGANGAFALTLNSVDQILLINPIGNTTPLASLTAMGGGITRLLNNITTSGTQTYNNAVSLEGNIALTSNSNGNISFNDVVNGAQTLAVNTGGVTNFNGTVGGSTALTSLTTDAGGSTNLAANVTTSGAQTYNDAVSLGGNSTVSSTGGSNITFGSTVNGGNALTINTTGNTNFNGVVGGTSRLASLTTNAGGTTNISGGVNTTGAQTYNDNVVLGANSTFSSNGSGDISFIGTLVGATHSLAVNTSGVTNFNGVSGVTTLTTDTGGSTVIGMPGITTSGTQTYNDAVKIKAGATPTDQVELGGGLLRFNSTLDSFDNLNKGQLQFNSAAVFNNYVGSIIPLGYLTAGAVTMNAGNSSFATVTTSGFQLYNGAITLGADTTLTSQNASSAGIFLLNGANGAFNLTLNSLDQILLINPIGSTTPLASLTATGGGLTRLLNNITTSGAQNYDNAVSLEGNIALISDSNGNISFNNVVNGAQALTVNTGGVTSFNAAVGGTAALTSLTTDAAGSTNLAGNVTTTGAQTYNDAVNLGADVALRVGGISDITFNSTIDGAHALSTDTLGTTIFAGAIGGTTPLASLTTSANGTTNLNGSSVNTTGSQTYGNAVELGAATTLSSSDSGDIVFNGLLDGAFDLTVNTTGANIFNAAVGSNTPLASLTLDGAGTTHFGLIITLGNQRYFRAIDLNNDITLTSIGAGNITFFSTVDGAHALTINTNGSTIFNSDVGADTALASLTTDAGGTTNFLSDSTVTTSGGQTYSDAVILGDDTTLTSTGGGDISFASTLDAADVGIQSLTVNTSGNTIFSSNVGISSALNNLTTDAGGTTRINGGNVATLGAQTYNDAVRLGASTSLAGNGIFFNNTLDSSGIVRALNLSNTGINRFGGAVGSNSALASITTTTGSTTQINGGSVNTIGTQTYNNVTLGADATTTSTGGAEIRFSGALDSSGTSHALTVNTSGVSRFVGLVGSTLALSSLTTDAGGTTNISSNVNTTGNQTYNDAVAINSNLALTSTANGDINFATTLDSNLIARTLAINTGGATIFGGAVGGTTGLLSLSTDAPGSTQIDGGSVQTTGGQTYNDAVTVGADTTFTSTTNGNINFASTLNGAHDINVNTGGVSTFHNTTVNSLTTDATGSTTLNGAVNTAAAQNYNDAVNLGANTTLNVTGGVFDILFGSTVDGGFSLDIDTPGNTTFNGAVGNTIALTSLTTGTNGTTNLNGGSVRTSGAQTYGNAVVLGADTTLTSTSAGDITFDWLVDGPFALTLNTSGANVFNATVGSNNALTSLTTDAGGSTNIGNNINTSGNQTYNDAINLTGDAALSSSAGALSFTTIDGSHNAGLNALTTITGSGAIGSNTPLTSLTINSGGIFIFNGGAITTTDDQTYNNVVRLGANTTTASTSGGDIYFGSNVNATVNGGQSLTVNTTGTTTFNALVGLTADLTSLTTDAGGTTNINGTGVRTTGAQTYNDAVNINANMTLSSSAAGALTFNSTLLGTGVLNLNTTGATNLNDAVNVGGLTTNVGGTTNINGGSIISAGGLTFNDAVNLGADTTISSALATAFASTINGAHSLAITGGNNVNLNGVVGGVTPLTSLTVTAPGTIGLNSTSYNTTGAQTYNGAVFVSLANPNIALNSSSGGDIRFASTVNGATNMTVNTSGVTRFENRIGNTNTLLSLTTNGGGTLVSGGSVRTTGAQTYNDTVSVGADTTFTSTTNGNISFASTLDGAYDVNVNTGGVGTFHNTALNSLTTDATGSTSLNGTVSTSEAQTYNDAVNLGTNTLLNVTGGVFDILFGSTVDGGFNLGIDTPGNTTFNGAVGNTTALTNLTIGTNGTTNLNGGSVRTSSSQTYGNAVVLGADTTLSSTSGNIAFNWLVDGPFALTLNTSGANVFNAAVGSNNALTSLTTDAGGSTNIASNVNTTGNQTYNDAINLIGDAALTSSAGTLSFTTINGAHNLALNSSNITGTGAIGGNKALTSLTTNTGGSFTFSGGTITTTNNQTYNKILTLGANTITKSIGGGDIHFGSNVNAAVNGGQSLTVNTTGTTTFDALVGQAADLASLTTDAGGTTNINGTGVRTTGAQTYNDAVNINANMALSSSAAGALTFNSALSGTGVLNLNTTGATNLNGVVSVGGLTTNAGGTTNINGGSVTSAGGLTFNDAVNLGADTTTSSALATVFASTINGAHSLDITGSNNVNLNGVVGGVSPLTSLTVTAPGTIGLNSTSYNTTGAQTYNGAVFVSLANPNIALNSTSNGDIRFANTVNGSTNMTVNTAGVTRFEGAVGGSTALLSLTTNSAGSTLISGGSVRTTGAQTYNDAVSLGANADLTSTLASILFANNVFGTNRNLTLNTATGLTLNTNFNLGNGILHLNPGAGGSTQTGGSIIAGSLLFTGVGNINFDEATNDVNTLAADIHNNLVYNDADDLTIGSINGVNGISTDGSVLVTVGGNLTLANEIAAAPAGNANSLVLVIGDSFINNAGATPLHPGVGGRFLVYSTNPAENTLNGMLYQTKRYNTTYTSEPPSSLTDQTSNMMLYNFAPVLTFTAVDKTKHYGYLFPAFTYTVTGYVDGDTSSTAYSGTPDLTSSANVASTPGNYDINIGLAGVSSQYNYTLVGVDGMLNITPAPLTVTADNASRPRGTPNPAFTASFNGFVLGQDEHDLMGILLLTTSATPSSPPGNYAIVPSGVSSSNYDISFVDGTLTVTGISPSPTPRPRPDFDFDGQGLSTTNPSYVGQLTNVGFSQDNYCQNLYEDNCIPLFGPAVDQYIIIQQ